MVKQINFHASDNECEIIEQLKNNNDIKRMFSHDISQTDVIRISLQLSKKTYLKSSTTQQKINNNTIENETIQE